MPYYDMLVPKYYVFQSENNRQVQFELVRLVSQENLRRSLEKFFLESDPTDTGVSIKTAYKPIFSELFNNSIEIQVGSTMRVLGAMFDSKLSWEIHITLISNMDQFTLCCTMQQALG